MNGKKDCSDEHEPNEDVNLQLEIIYSFLLEKNKIYVEVKCACIINYVAVGMELVLVLQNYRVFSLENIVLQC